MATRRTAVVGTRRSIRFSRRVETSWDPTSVALNDFQTLRELAERYRLLLQGRLTAGVEKLPSVTAATDLLGLPTAESVQTYALVMKGGGVKGLALAAAAEVLEGHYSFTSFAGTSAGAIAATLMAAGYRASELREILAQKDFREFLDPAYKRLWNLVISQWLNSGEPVEEWVAKLLEGRFARQADVKMPDLPSRAVVYAATERDGPVRFDSADPKDSDLAVYFAVRCSMAIPYFFAPVYHGGQEVFDGGLLENFPLEDFLGRHTGPFVGLYLTSGGKTYRQRKLRFRKLLNLMLVRGERVTVDKHENSIVVIDPTPISTTQFGLGAEEKNFLIAAGRAGALRFLHRVKRGGVTLEERDQATETEGKLRAVLVHRYRVRRALRATAAVVVGISIGALGCWLRRQPPTPPPTLCAKAMILGRPAFLIDRRADLRLKVDDVRLEVETDCTTELVIRSEALDNFRLPAGGQTPFGGEGPWLSFVFKDRQGKEIKKWIDKDEVLSAGVEDCKGTSINRRELGLGEGDTSFSVSDVRQIAFFEWKFASEWRPQVCK